MLPKNKLAFKTLAKLKIYAGGEHPHQAQLPTFDRTRHQGLIEREAVVETPPRPQAPRQNTESRTNSSMAVVSSSDILGTGRRKTAVARCAHPAGRGARFASTAASLMSSSPTPGSGTPLSLRWSRRGDALSSTWSFASTAVEITGQADACKLGIARALKKFDEQLADGLRDSGLLTRDSRMKERKKYGLRGARRGTPVLEAVICVWGRRLGRRPERPRHLTFCPP